MYLPAINVASGIYGTRKAGLLGLTSGIIMAISGAVILPGVYAWELEVMSLYQCIWMWLLLFLGVAYFALGSLLLRDKSSSASTDSFLSKTWQRFYSLLSNIKEGFGLLVRNFHFPIVFLASPALLILYEFLSVLKPDNKFIDNQSKLATRGECGLWIGDITTAYPTIVLHYDILESFNLCSEVLRSNLMFISQVLFINI